ncbi:SecD/SecF family protein translocase subunit [Paludicola sp. MB14-C6]|uniref:preprotein translocase subunit SecD n=1 Tax=Paludihabitans sp. MB14-C6 TaxID=3070656 RepID=UPI0027DD6217|nr:SecD/SecF family protein translocase subunit [Paludicola sp. MB14-C6]WMJ23275.1 SecD/SecF family protein translocase subunit [Paludicola sp. MB14-C6]
MKRVGKPIFFIVAIIIIAFTTLSFTGISTKYGDKETIYVKGASNIRWGIDIRGGVDVTFTPPKDKNINPTEAQMNAAAEVMRQRLVSLNITDYVVYVDAKKDRIVVQFPWKEGESAFDPEAAIKELGDTALLTFREGYEIDKEGAMIGATKDNIILEGKDVLEAKALYGPTKEGGSNEHYVSLKLDSNGTKKFADATAKLANKGSISIWMDDKMISNPSVNSAIPNGQAIISGSFDEESAKALANKINAGALPFKLQTETYSTITPTLGTGARDVMLLSGLISFILVCLFMIITYKLPGVVASIALLGQVGGMVAASTGFFDGINSFTMTIPGIAGIILSIGMGVDANIITSERIKEEIRAGKSIDGAISLGYERGFSAIFDGNITVIIIAIILMGAFGAPSNFLAKAFNSIFFFFGPATQGAVYSFGFTLLVGVVLNFVCGVTASRLMLKSISKFKCFRNPKLYGGLKND